MSCSISITTVSGAGSFTGGVFTELNVTAQISGCKEVKIDVFQLPSNTLLSSSNVAVPSSGSLDASVSARKNGFACGMSYLVKLTCLGGKCADEQTIELPCPDDCCVDVTVAPTFECREDGSCLVKFELSGYDQTTCAHDFYLDFGAFGTSPHYAFANSGSFSIEIDQTFPNAAGQTITASVRDASHPDCPDQEFTFDLPDCTSVCCPKVTFKVGYGPCDAGQSNVTFTVKLDVPKGCPPVIAWIDFGDGSPVSASHSFSAPSGTFSWSHPYPTGGYQAQLVIGKPDNCLPTMMPVTVDCPKTDCCPDVSVSPCIPDCGPDPDRIVKFQITVAPKPAPCPPKAISFQMDFGNGTKGDPVTIPAGGPAYTYTETCTYSGADALQDNTPALTVSQPPECAGTYGSVVIPKCCKKSRAKLCEKLLWLMSWAFTLAVLALLSWLFGSMFSPSISLKAFFALASVGVLILIIFLILCSKCLCGWVYRLLWRVFFGAGLLYAIHAACTIYHWQTVLIGVLLILLGFVFLWMWTVRCCVSECYWLKEIVFWFGLNILVFAGFLFANGFSGGCQFVLFTIGTHKFTVLGVATIVWALLGYHYLQKCPPAKGRR